MIALTVALPLLAAFLLPLLPALARQFLGPLVLLAVAAFGLCLAGNALDAPSVVAIGDFRPPLGIVFYADGVAGLFVFAIAVVTLLLWPCATPNGQPDPQITRKHSLTLLMAAASCALALSGDLFNIYVFYELAAVAGYGLAAGSRTPAAQVATFRFTLLGSLGSLLALIGITLIYFRAGSLNLAHLAELAPSTLHDPLGLAGFLLILLGFGVKSELFLVNSWAPEVYATAESRVSALLAGLISKLALLAVVRLLVLVFPVPEASQLLLVLGMLGILTGELAAYRARDFRRLLAWSSIGQLGAAFVAFAIPGPAGLMAGIAVALHHLMVKPALFLLAERWGGNLAQLAGAARNSPIAAALFVLFALSLIGVPPLPGFWAKYLLLSGLAGEPAGLWWLAGLVVLTTTVVEAVYLFRIIGTLYGHQQGSVMQSRTATTGSGIFALLLVGTALSAPLLAAPLQKMATQLADTDGYVAQVISATITAPQRSGTAP